MFSSREQLERRTGPYGVGRFSYLRSLVTELQESDDEASKKQVLANLANFAYDPINYDYFKRLRIIDVFFDSLDSDNQKLVEFAIGGLCNLALDKEIKESMIAADGVNRIIKCLSSNHEETVLSAMTTLMFLITPKSKADITSPSVVECMLRFSKSSNKRFSNLANVFLQLKAANQMKKQSIQPHTQDYCTEEQIEEARSIFDSTGT